MSQSESIWALRRANPRTRASFGQSVEIAAHAVTARIDAAGIGAVAGAPKRRVPERQRRRRLAGVSVAGVSIAAAAAAAVALTVGSPGGGPGVESAAAAVKKAAIVTAAAAERSGTAVVRITHDGELWAEKSIRWHGEDIAVSDGFPQRGEKPGSELLVVGGILYWIEPEAGGWIASDPAGIDPDSGTTPGEVLAAVQEDVGGETLRRITGGMNGLTTEPLEDGSTVYSGTVAAGLIARETGFKEGQSLRAFPFGYVAHDEAADPNAPLDTAVTVGPDGAVREIAVTWGTWTYTVTYSKLGATPTLVAPDNARSMEEWRASLRAGGGN
jgi:hypothetical protein